MIRRFLSTLGILIGVASITAMGAVIEGARHEALLQLDALGTTTLIARGKITPQMIQQLQSALPSLSAIAPCHLGSSCATTPSYAQIRGLSLCEGRFLCSSDLTSRRRVAIIGREVGPYHVGDRLPSGETVIGILAPTHWRPSKVALACDPNHLVLIPFHEHPIDELLIRVADTRQIRATATALRTRFSLEVVEPAALLAQTQRTTHLFALVLGSIAALSLLVGGVGIANIMLATVTQRRREIAIRRAIGATRRHIALQFLRETFALAFVGTFLGLLAGLVATLFIARQVGWPIAIPLPLIALSVGVALVTSLLAGIFPALHAAKQDPLEPLSSR